MKHLIFVYGTLKRGHHNARFLEDARFVATGVTEPRFRMISLGAFPGVCHGGETAIHGEIYEVDDETLAAVDRLEGHPHFYMRQEALVGGMRVAMYILQEDYIAKRLRFFNPEEITTGVWA